MLPPNGSQLTPPNVLPAQVPRKSLRCDAIISWIEQPPTILLSREKYSRGRSAGSTKGGESGGKAPPAEAQASQPARLVRYCGEEGPLNV